MNVVNKEIDNIKIIEEQIIELEKKKPLFFQKDKLQKYNQKLEKLESVRRYLYKRLEYMINNN